MAIFGCARTKRDCGCGNDVRPVRAGVTGVTVAANIISSFSKLLNYPKRYNPGSDRSLPPGELILNDTPKGLPLVPSHRTKVLTCSYILHRAPPQRRDMEIGRASCLGVE